MTSDTTWRSRAVAHAMPTTKGTPKTSKFRPLVDSLEKGTAATRDAAEAELAEQLVAAGNWVEGAEQAAPLLIAMATTPTSKGRAAAMRLLARLVSEGDRAIATGPVSSDLLLCRLDEPYVKLLKSKKLRSIAEALADAAPTITRWLADRDAAVRGAAAHLLAHIPEAAGAARTKLAAAAAAERDVSVRAALAFARGFVARYTQKKITSAEPERDPRVLATRILARLVGAGGALGDAGGALGDDDDRATLVAAIQADDLDARKFPWREGALDKVISNVVDSLVGGMEAARLFGAAVVANPGHERSIHWAAAALSFAFERRKTPLAAHDLSAEQKALLLQLAVRDWMPLNAEFASRGLPPHARDRSALVTTGGSSEPLLERKVGPKGSKLLDELLRLQQAGVPLGERHAWLSQVLTTSEHLEVARLAGRRAMGLRPLAMGETIKLAGEDPKGAGGWANQTVATTTSTTPGDKFWLTLAISIQLANGTRQTVEPEVEPFLHLDGQEAVFVAPVLLSIPPARRDALLRKLFAADPSSDILSFLPIAYVSPSPAIADLVLETTSRAGLERAYGETGVASNLHEVIPNMETFLRASDGAIARRVEKRLSELRTMAPG